MCFILSLIPFTKIFAFAHLTVFDIPAHPNLKSKLLCSQQRQCQLKTYEVFLSAMKANLVLRDSTEDSAGDNCQMPNIFMPKNLIHAKFVFHNCKTFFCCCFIPDVHQIKGNFLFLILISESWI